VKFEGFKTFFVVNPRSAGGKTATAWKKLEPVGARYVPEYEARMTQGPGHATELARNALKNGFEMIVSVGGDGTNNEVINGFFENGKPVKKDAVFGCIPRGTGCDFARGMGIARAPEDAFRRLSGRTTVSLDVGRIEYTPAGGDAKGKTAVRYFVNIAGFGANGDVVARVNRSGKKLGGFATFLGATVASLASFKNPTVEISLDGGKFETATLNVVFVCNAQFCGGGMRAGPDAEINDGLLDLTIVGDMSKTEALLSGRLLYSGKIYSHPKVRHERVKTLTARPANAGAEILVEADGEQPGLLPATYSILPGAVQLKL
jgi:YegS/Rv2252/BmrU family lipid kinase